MTQKPKILFVAHNSVLSPSFGGVEAYINTLTKYLKNEYDVYWYVPYLGDDGVGVQLIGPDKQSIKKILFKTSFENWQLSCPEREEIFKNTLQELDIQLVHFHHLAGHPPSLVRVAKESDARTVFTFHDYYSLCHVSNLVNSEGKYCRPDKIPISACDTCLNNKYAILPGSQQIRREYWGELFKYIDGLIFNTQGGFDLVSKIYPEVASHPNVAILPVAIEEIIRPALPPKSGDELKVAILGNLNHHKGANVIIEAIEQLSGDNISFHFFGEIEKSYDDKLALSSNTKVYRYGRYPSGELPKELFLCDISLHASIWPETYVLALSEAWAAGLVPIVSDMGALGERVIDGINGIQFQANSSTSTKELASILRLLVIDRSLLDKIQISISDLSISWMSSHARQLNHFYQETLTNQLEQPIPRSTLQSTNTFPLVWALFPSHEEAGPAPSFDPLGWMRLLKKKFTIFFR
jgi:glycosyltransferase involved in cell wall biosynthesis